MQNTPLANSEQNNQNDFNIKEQLFIYLRYWKWFLLSVLLCLALVFAYLRYSIIEYGSMTSILIKDEKKGGSSEYSAISDLNIFSSKSNVDNEIAILKSRTLSQKVVSSLELDISYYSVGRVVDIELYKDSPVKILFTEKSKDYDKLSKSFMVSVISNKKFTLSEMDKKHPVEHFFGEKIHNELGTFVILKDVAVLNPNEVSEIVILKSTLESKADSFRGKLGVISLEKTNVINLTTTDQVAKRGQDFLNEIANQYNQDAITDRNQVANFTKDFINKRLEIITGELGNVEEHEEVFKKSRKLTSLEADSELSLSKSVDYEKDVLEFQTNLKVNNFMLNQVINLKEDEFIPSNVLSSSSSNQLISQYNALILEKRRQLKSATDINPAIETINNSLISLRRNIIASLNNVQNDLKIQISDLSNQQSRYDGKVAKVPTNDRYYNEIARQQHVKESLYLYLLQKREETELSLAATSQKAKIIDTAYLTGPVSPKKSLLYLIAFVLGLLIPFGILFLIKFLDTKLKTRLDVVGKISVPYLGDLPKSETNEEVIKVNSRSSSAEAIRMIRTNLDFMLAHIPEDKCKTIFITSSIPKEGKTFIAVNLATTIALSGKKSIDYRIGYQKP